MDPFAVSKVCACICLVSGEAKLIIYEAKKTFPSGKGQV